MAATATKTRSPKTIVKTVITTEGVKITLAKSELAKLQAAECLATSLIVVPQFGPSAKAAQEALMELIEVCTNGGPTVKE